MIGHPDNLICMISGSSAPGDWPNKMSFWGHRSLDLGLVCPFVNPMAMQSDLGLTLSVICETLR